MKKVFFRIVKKNKGKFIFLTLFSLFITVIGIMLPYLNGRFIDLLTAGTEYKIIFEMCISILGLGLLNVGLFYIKQILDAKIKLQSAFEMKVDIIEYLRKISILLYKKYNPAYLNNRTEQDINDIVAFIITNYAAFFINIIQFVCLLIIIFNISSEIAFLMLVFFPIYYVVYLIVKKPLYYKNYEAKEAQNSYYNTLNDQFSFMEDIKISANDKYNNFYMNEAYKEYENKYMNYIKVSGKFLSLDGVISVGFQVITFLYGGWKTLNGDMSVGELTIICTYFSMALQLIKYYFELGKSYQSVLASLNRINEIFLIKTENEGTEEVIQIQKIVGRISFKYEDDAPLLDDLNILLEPGKVYCIIGENGSGKSTISKILIGLLRIDSIDINGINIKDINMKRLRNEKIVYISQALNYPNRTIQEVYCEYKENIELQDVLNEIYKMKLSEERNIVELYENNWYRNVNALSGGEKQIITILKCIIKEADFIIFDEPTSNLDVNRTAILIETIKYIKSKGKIILIVTHDQALIDIGNSTIDLGKK